MRLSAGFDDIHDGDRNFEQLRHLGMVEPMSLNAIMHVSTDTNGIVVGHHLFPSGCSLGGRDEFKE